MNHAIVRRLVLKDWYLNRLLVAGYTAGGLLGLAVVCIGTPWSFYVGSILLITFMITTGIHVTVVTVVQEKTEQTLPFVMSLPISPRDYVTAKVAANLTLFLVPWLILTGGALSILSLEGARSGAMMPFATLVMTYILAAAVITLSTALVTESLGWTLVAMGVTNLLLQVFLYAVSRVPVIASGMKGRGAVWDGTVFTLLAAEIAVATVALLLAFLIQSRRRDLL